MLSRRHENSGSRSVSCLSCSAAARVSCSCRSISKQRQCCLLPVLLLSVATCFHVVAACQHSHAVTGITCAESQSATSIPEHEFEAFAAAAATAQSETEEPFSMIYQDISEAELAAAVAAEAEADAEADAEAAHNRNLLHADTGPSVKLYEVPAADAQQAQIAAATGADANKAVAQDPVRRCGARDVTAAEHSEISLHLEQYKALTAVHQRARLSSWATAAALPPQRTSLNVPLYFHVITGKKPNSIVAAPQELLLQQLRAMNEAYGRYNIRFDLKGITRVQSEAWAIAEINSAEEMLMKSKLRKGGLGELNIYVLRPASGTLGWSTFPWEAVKLGESFDGVLVHVGTMPGGTMKPYNKGLTMVHEVGHWLGLLHVFENGCDTPGDSVEDTPPQASAAYGCPLKRHTCSNSQVTDPVTNYMSYTDDACMTGFTRGQADRVLAVWDIYRAPNAPAAVRGGKSAAAGSYWEQGDTEQDSSGTSVLEQGHQMPESLHFIPAESAIDPAAAFAAKQSAGAVSGTGGQSNKPLAAPQLTSAAPSPPKRGNWPSNNPFMALTAPSGLLGGQQSGSLHLQDNQQQEQDDTHEKKKTRKRHKAGWGAWLSGRPAPAPVRPVHASSLSYEQLRPEMGQFVADAGIAARVDSNLQQAYAQQQPLYAEQHQQQYQQQQQQGLVLGYAGPLGPQYLTATPAAAGGDVMQSQATLLAAMGGVQAFPMAAAYDGLGAGGFNVAAAAEVAAPAYPEEKEDTDAPGRRVKRVKSKAKKKGKDSKARRQD